MAKQTATATIWRNRITRTALVYPEDLLANPLNWRIHPSRQQEAVSDILETIGQVQTVILNEGDDLVVDGHLRVILALRANEVLENQGKPRRKMAASYVDLAPEEVKIVLASFDTVGAMAGRDAQVVKDLLAQVPDMSVGSGALQSVLDDMMRSARIATATDFLAPALTPAAPLADAPPSPLQAPVNTVTDPSMEADDFVPADRPLADEKTVLVALSFSLTQDERALVLGAVRRCQQVYGLSTTNQAIHKICDLYLQGEMHDAQR